MTVVESNIRADQVMCHMQNETWTLRFGLVWPFSLTNFAMSIVTIVHSHSGASAQVHTFGATVVAFVNSTGREALFLSRDAKMDGSKAIRGGIPLVFPQFGATPDTTMPQHGFARCNSWNVQDSYDNEESAGMTFTLDWKDVMQGKGDGAWSNGTFDCTLKLHVQVQASSLTTTLTIQNQGSMSFDFQTLFHTYFLVQQHEALKADQCHVIGLEGYQCEDKISGDTYTCSSQPIIIDSNIDHIYTPPEGKLDVQITVKTGNETFATMEAFGFVNGQKVPTSCVVWNPHAKKAAEMPDFHENGHMDMICCEPGLLCNIPVLDTGKECVFTQVITAQ